jgi:tetratricopeptide (TPR) repeat protein
LSIYKANYKKIKLESAHFFADCSKNLRDFLANKFRLEGKSMSSLDVERLLSPHQIPENIISEIKNVLHESEIAQYGGDQNSNSLQNRKNLKMKMEGLVKSLDKFIILFLMVLGLMLGSSSPEASASTEESFFALGNKAFDEGNYSESQKYFQQDLVSKGPNAAVYYNLASAHFRQGSGHLGFALFYLRKAAEIWPEHSDIKANLNYLRTLRLDQIAMEKQDMAELIFKHSLSLPLSTDALLFLILFLAIFLSFFSILALYLRENRIIKWSKLILFIFFMGSVIIYVTRLVSSSGSYGVINTTEAKVYSSTSKESILLFTLHEAA